MIIVLLEVTQDNGFGVPTSPVQARVPVAGQKEPESSWQALPCQSYHRTFAMDSFDPTIFFFCSSDNLFTCPLNSQKRTMLSNPRSMHLWSKQEIFKSIHNNSNQFQCFLNQYKHPACLSHTVFYCLKPKGPTQSISEGVPWHQTCLDSTSQVPLPASFQDSTHLASNPPAADVSRNKLCILVGS